MNIMSEKVRKYNKLLILLILGVSVLFSRLLIGGVFLANTPRVNPLFIRRLKNVPKTVANLPNILFTKKQEGNFNYKGAVVTAATPEIYSQVPFKQASKGVYAGERADVQYAKFSQSEIDWEEIRLKTQSGKEIILAYPKDQPPVKEILNIIQSE